MISPASTPASNSLTFVRVTVRTTLCAVYDLSINKAETKCFFFFFNLKAIGIFETNSVTV